MLTAWQRVLNWGWNPNWQLQSPYLSWSGVHYAGGYAIGQLMDMMDTQIATQEPLQLDLSPFQSGVYLVRWGSSFSFGK
jgi:hypothetical protein